MQIINFKRLVSIFIYYYGQLVIMGTSQSSNVIASRWEFVARIEGQYSLVRDKNGREGEQYEIPIPPHAIVSQEFSIYTLRKALPQQIIGVYGSQFKSQPGLCTSDPSFRVITEHVCLRFNDKFLLNVQEVVYTLVEAIKGYQFLYGKVGCFSVTPKMMGLTSEGELRVWMHQQFGQNSPQMVKKSIKTLSIDKYQGVNQEEDYMIKQVLTLVEQHAQNGIFEKYLGGYKDLYFNFATITKLLEEIQQRYRIPTVQRIDLLKKGSNLVI